MARRAITPAISGRRDERLTSSWAFPRPHLPPGQVFLSGGRIALHAPLDELLESSVRLGGVPADIERFVREHRLQALSREVAGPVIARGRDAGAIPPATPTVSVDPATLEDLFLALTA